MRACKGDRRPEKEGEKQKEELKRGEGTFQRPSIRNRRGRSMAGYQLRFGATAVAGVPGRVWSGKMGGSIHHDDIQEKSNAVGPFASEV